MDFKTVVKERRSAVNFQSGVAITKEELNQIFEVTKNYPSCFNLQHAHYYVARSEEMKQTIKQGAMGQHKTLTASATIVVCGDKKAFEKAPSLYEGMRMLKIIDDLEYNQTVETINSMYTGFGEEFQREEAIRNAALSAMIFMLAAKDAGWDTCPMIGFDPEAIKTIYNIPDNHIPMLMITLGIAVTDKLRPRGYRHPVGEFVHYID